MSKNGMYEIDRTQKLKRMPIENKSIPMICAWCGKLYHVSTWQVKENQKIGASHGICPKCRKEQEEKARKCK